MFKPDDMVEIIHPNINTGNIAIIVTNRDSQDCYTVRFDNGSEEKFHSGYLKLYKKPIQIGQKIIIKEGYNKAGNIGKVILTCSEDPNCRIIRFSDGKEEHFQIQALTFYAGKGLKSSKEEPNILLKINTGNRTVEEVIPQEKIAYDCLKDFLIKNGIFYSADSYGRYIKIDSSGIEKLMEIFPLSSENNNVFTIDTGIYLMEGASYVRNLYETDRMNFFVRFFNVVVLLNKMRNTFKNKEIYVKLEYSGDPLREFMNRRGATEAQDSVIITLHGRSNTSAIFNTSTERGSWFRTSWGKPLIYNQVVGGKSKLQNGIVAIELCLNTIYHLANCHYEEAENLLCTILELAYKKDYLIKTDSAESEKQLKDFFHLKRKNIKTSITNAHKNITHSMTEIKRNYDVIAESSFKLSRINNKTTEIKTLTEVDGVEHVILSEEKILIITKDIVFKLEDTDKTPLELPIGQYMISLDIRNSQINISPFSDKIIYPFHPYVNSSGLACFGNYKEFIIESMGEMDYHNTIGYILEWLKNGFNTTETPENDLEIFIRRAVRIKKKKKPLTQKQETDIINGTPYRDDEDEDEEEDE